MSLALTANGLVIDARDRARFIAAVAGDGGGCSEKRILAAITEHGLSARVITRLVVASRPV